MHVTLADLPAFRVVAIDLLADPQLHGEFTHLMSVREGRSWLYAGNKFSLIGDLTNLDAQTRRATFIAPFWSRESKVQVGSVVPWLDGYWQAYHLTMIVDPGTTWRRVTFSPSDAQHWVLGETRGWGKAGYDVPKGATPTQIEVEGWDHEHCELCRKGIGKGGDSAGYIDPDDHWLCAECYGRYAEPRNLAFALDT
ncbi:MAG TPA: hypothetical protein VJU77_03560 [Chthoniobacterales bacterium]|nr:hypothetical protein [Chthoniobacterales bacterium]